jgi:hypothetical protein
VKPKKNANLTLLKKGTVGIFFYISGQHAVKKSVDAEVDRVSTEVKKEHEERERSQSTCAQLNYRSHCQHNSTRGTEIAIPRLERVTLNKRCRGLII